MSELDKLLITGVSGYIGLWIVKKAIEEHKFEVYGSVIDKNNEAKTKKIKDALGDETFNKLNLVSANLLDKDSINEAVEGMNYILHVASPFLLRTPKDPKEVIDPAVNGTKYVLEAASKSKVKRVVVTSSIAAIMDHTRGDVTVTEESYPPHVNELSPYYQSKYYAEKEAADFYKNQQGEHKVEVVIVNPGVVIGKLLSSSDGTSEKVYKDLLMGDMMSIPKLYFPYVDVQDVADAHFKALEKGVPGERYAIVEKSYYFPEFGQYLYDKYHQFGYNPTTGEMLLATIWLASFFDAGAKILYKDWRVNCQISNEKSMKDLEMTYKPVKKALEEMVESFMDLNVVEDKRPKQDEDKSVDDGAQS